MKKYKVNNLKSFYYLSEGTLEDEMTDSSGTKWIKLSLEVFTLEEINVIMTWFKESELEELL